MSDNGHIVGDEFEDYGNAPEYFVSAFAAYERLSGDLIRLFLCKEKGGALVLEYTAIVPACAVAAMGHKCLEIAKGDLPAFAWRLTGAVAN